jgi:hypothetical protein
MADNKKNNGRKKKRRRSYLADYKKDASGKFHYTGNVYEFDGDDSARKKYVLITGILSVASFALAFGQECLPGTQMSNTFYVLIPWLLQFLASTYLVWAYIRFAFDGPKLKEYIYEKTEKQFPVRSLLVLIFSAATVAAEIVYLCINGPGDRVAPALARPCLALINCGASLSLHLLAKAKTHYRKI